MKMGTLTIVANKQRYRLLKLENRYYLIDTKIDIFTYLLPFLDWFRKHKGIEISKELADSIQLNPTRQKNGSSALAVGLSSLLVVLLRRIVYLLDFSFSQSAMILIASGIILIVIGLRLFMLENEKKKLAVDFNQYKSVKVLIHPISIKMILYALCSYLFFLMCSLAFLVALVTVKNNNIILIIATFLCSFMLTFINVFNFTNDEYKVRVYE